MKTKNVQRFNEYYKAMLFFLRKKTPKSQHRSLNQVLLKYSQKTRSGGETATYEYLSDLLKNYDPVVNHIMKNDEFMFTPEFTQKTLFLMTSFDFKKLWRLNCLKQEDKKVIFRYLKLIYIQLSLALNKNEEKVKQMIEVIKSEDEIEKEARENPNAFDEEKTGGLTDIAKLFGNDDLLSELAKDISEEVNLQDTLKDLMSNQQLQGGNPIEAMMNICQNPEIQNMVNNLQTKVTKKMQDKNIQPEDIQKSAGTLQDNLMGALKGVPGGRQLQRMMKNMNLDQMMQDTAQNMQKQQQHNPTAGPNPAMAARQAGVPSNIAQMMAQMQEQMETNPEMRNFMNQMQQGCQTN